MTQDSRAPFAAAHQRASDAFRNLSIEEKRMRMRAAGLLGLTPHVGDKVRVRGALMTWRYGVVVGVDGQGRVSVVCNDDQGAVVHAPLEDFAGGSAVEMVQRAAQGLEYAVAARATRLVGKRSALSEFDARKAPTRVTNQQVLGGLLAVFGLAVAAVALSGDQSWDENLGRYRDSRGRFA